MQLSKSNKDQALFALRSTVLLGKTRIAARYCGIPYLRFMQLAVGDSFREGELEKLYEGLCVVKGNQIENGQCTECGSFLIAHALTVERVCIDCFFGHKRGAKK